MASPILHGAAGAWDEIIFAAAFVISVIVFIALAFTDHKRDTKEEKNEKES